MSAWDHKLVLVHSDVRLFGKVVGEYSDSFDIEFFGSVAERETKRVARREVSHAALPVQTRVFIQTAPDIWRVGRVLDLYRTTSGAFSYSVKFPNSEIEEFAEDACYVRCLDRHADPSKILAAGCMETQFFADRRRRALRRIWDLRNSAQGLTAILSAPVELVPHQIATVRRVLNDSHLRYLLADEVGLGKTIEAGLIIRQLLLDDPSLSVVVVAPSTLVDQWRFELSTKCLLTDVVRVHSHEELNDVEPSRPPDLLVVDEAHRLIVPESSSSGFTAYDHLRRLSAATARLLLLSATPALGDEPRLLALLNLLDPSAYPLEDLELFRRRVGDRQTIGRFLLALQPRSATFVLRQQAIRALELFPDDPIVHEEAERLRLHLDDAPTRDAAVRALRNHIAETYRIHQRLIRTRRADVGSWMMRSRGPEWPTMTHVRFFFSEDRHAASLLLALESWRGAANSCSINDELLATALANRWWEMVSAAWQSMQVLIDVVAQLPCLFDAEADALLEIQRVAGIRAEAEDRHSVAARTIREWGRQLGTDASGRPKKIICFSGSAGDARRLGQHLAREIGEGGVVTLVGFEGNTASAVAEFSTSRSAAVLVCDSESEEGLNLQFASGIVHMNLPLEVTHLEQRVGRLDRFGRRLDRVDHRVLLPDDSEDAPWRSWFSVIANGFRVFNRSVSDVQFCLKDLEAQARLRLFREGAYAVDGLIEEIDKKLSEERTRLDEQHALDALSDLVEGGDTLAQRIEDAEHDEKALAADIEPWIAKVLGLSIDADGIARAEVKRIAWATEILLPAIPWKTVLEPALKSSWTWRRRVATSQNQRAPGLLRPGCHLFEALERIALWDDRGIAYATWRVDPHASMTWKGLRLIWLIEPAFDSHRPVYSRREGAALERRAEAMLPRLTVEHWLDGSGNVVEDSDMLGLLARPYNKERNARRAFDINLGSNPEALREVIDGGHFVSLIRDVTSKARTILLEMPVVANALAQARLTSDRELRVARRSIEARRYLARRYPGLVQPPRILEESDIEAIRQAVESPRISLSEIGFMVVSAEPPLHER